MVYTVLLSVLASRPTAAGAFREGATRSDALSSVLGNNYQVLEVVGEGAYGIVCSAVHRPSGRKVAIKKIAPFDHSMFCLRTLRELKLLKFLSEAGVSENIISILDIIKPRSIDEFKEVYCEPLSSFLFLIISNNPLPQQ